MRIAGILMLASALLGTGSPAHALDVTPAIPDSLEPAPAETRGERAAILDTISRSVDYLWVLRTALVTPASIDSVVARAARMGVRGLLVQVVGRGDAFFDSRLLPRAEALGRTDPDFDPLARLVAESKPKGLEVHAWINCMLVWSAPWRPRSPAHVLNAHPEWITSLRDGRRMTRLSPDQCRHLGVEGAYLAAGHPAVRAWIASLAAEIATRYAVDGIHLDYIRQPDTPVGFDPTTRARFALEDGIDPAMFHRLAAAERGRADSAWTAFQCAQITAVVRAVRESLDAVRPGLILSAAVVADSQRAERVAAQRWRTWIEEGLVDRVFPMCYAPEVQKVMDQLVAFAGEFGTTDRIVPGIAVFNTAPSRAALKIRGARALGYPRLALYSYDALFEDSNDWDRLRDGLDSSFAPLVH